MGYTLPTGLISTYQGFADSFVSDFGRSCNVVYPSMQTPCSNCIVDPISHQSTNVYNGTGPAPFTSGSICPWCAGVGYKLTENKDGVTLRIYWKPRDFVRLGISAEKANSLIRVRGEVADLPKLRECEYLEVPDGNGMSRFKRFGEMVPYGIGSDRYIVGFWEKIN